jgi:hypothetical protein
MRSFGGICLLLGVAGFFYFSSLASGAGEMPDGLSVRQSLDYSAGRAELGKYACAIVAASGVLLALFPRGR